MQRYIVLLSFLIIFNIVIKAQSNAITISGEIRDAKSNKPIEFATIAAKKTETKAVFKGTITDENGKFSLESSTNDIFIEVSFIGYKTKTITTIDKSQSYLNLGIIALDQNSLNLDEVVVQGEKSTVEFKLDKKVFNVGKDISSTGVSALEVLNNVPSVNVDLEGSISLRGNTGVQILINGKPSVLADQGSNALGTITADMIDRVEVITNPSAKYDAEGTSGILNIVIKKEEKKGLNGSLTVNTGMPDNHSIGVSLNKRANKFNLFTQFGGGYRSRPGYDENINTDLTTLTRLESTGEDYRNEAFYNFAIGSDYYINNSNIITLTGRYTYEFEDQGSETEYWSLTEDDELLSQWLRSESTSAGNPKWQFDLQYKKQFEDNEDHVLLASAQGNFFGKEQESEYINTSIYDAPLDNDQNIETDFSQANYTFKADYTNPISDVLGLELGSAYTINDVKNDFYVESLVDEVWVPNANLINDFQFNQKVLGAYSTLSYEKKRWGVKAGIRIENTNLNTLLTTTDEKNEKLYTDFFPSIHSSFKINKMVQLQAGYSKRIYRPRLWDLNPFFNIRNTYNIRTGNPDLKPQYADSYEITSIFTYKKISINTSVYHLYTTDVIERVANYDDGVVITSPENIGVSNKTGLSIDGKYSPAKWISLNGDFNYGVFDRKGSYNDQTFDLSGDQWSGKITSQLKLPADFEMELSGNFQSGYTTVQGDASGANYANAGIRKKFLKGKLVINASVQDIFKSRNRERFVYEEDYTSYSYSERGRFFKLGISYGFGKGEAMYYSGGRR